MADRVGVLVTGQSAIAVSQLARELASDTSLQISTATTITQVWKAIETAHPRVVLLDMQLAGIGTPRLVAELAQKAKVATLLHSDRSSSAQLLLDAVEAGALAILDKPDCSARRAEMAPSIIWSICAAALANLVSHAATDFLPIESTSATSMLAISGGMGGVPALSRILEQLPPNAPGGIVISPLPAHVMGVWVSRLNNRCKMAVKLAVDGELIKPGQLLVAPGDSHVLMRRSAQGFVIAVKDGPAVFHQKPSIGILFNSIAENAGGDAVGVLLGGAGVDGVAGLMRLKNSGGRTIAESPQSSIISDAPARANRCGAVEVMVPANQIAAKMMELAGRSSSRAA